MSDEPTEIRSDGTQIWKNNKGQRHCDNDLPAVIWPNGDCVWYQNDKRHRDNDLPAAIWADGRCDWWVDGKLIKVKHCTKKQIEQFKKPYYLQRKHDISFNRFKNLIK